MGVAREEEPVRIASVAAAIFAIVGLGCAAHAETVRMKAVLDAAQETPPNDSKGTGAAEIALDTETLRLAWVLTFSGLTSPATAARFHGPAPMGEPGKTAVEFDGTESPIEGSAILTEAQAGQLLDGLWYMNVHTEKNPDGEIRGQVLVER